MLSRFSSLRVRHGTIVAYAALFLTLGGTSYAVATGSIDSREIKNNTVRSKDLRNNDIRSSDVRNSSLLARDFKAGQLPAGPAGPRGAQGAQGPRGATGSPGRDGFSGLVYVFSEDQALPANGSAPVFVECPGDSAPVGGGATVFDTQGTADLNDDVEVTNGEMDLNRSIVDFASGTNNIGWSTTVSNATADTDRVAVGMATCVTLGDGALARTRNLKRR